MNAEPAIIHSREKLGWAFLLISFTTFVAFVAGVFFLVTYGLQNWQRPLPVQLIANQGTVRVDEGNGVVRAIPVNDPPFQVLGGATIYTDAPVSAVLTVLADTQPLAAERARLQLYSNTGLRLDSASTPRFESSNDPQQLDLRLDNGRLRLLLAELEGQRPLVTQITTPHGEITIHQAGHYSLLVGRDETYLAVLDGEAEVTAVGETIRLATNQRAQFTAADPPIGPLIPQENLIRNGNFTTAWLSPDNPWELADWNIERPGQPPGTVKFVRDGEDSYAQVARFGQGHADIYLTQPIEQTAETLSFSPLWLQVTFSILEHDLAVCGFQGSECPLFIQIEYEDVNDNTHVWQQGFYANGEASDTTPYACFSCGGIQSAHDRVNQRELFTYDIDLKSELERQGGNVPHTIKRVTLASSGHSFAVQVFEVSLYTMALQESAQITP